MDVCVDGNVAILETRDRANAQAAKFPIVAGGDKDIEVAAVGISARSALKRSPVTVVSSRTPGNSRV